MRNGFDVRDLDVEDARATNARPLAAGELRRAVALLNEAIALLDGACPGNVELSLATAHAETALLLAESELSPVMPG